MTKGVTMNPVKASILAALVCAIFAGPVSAATNYTATVSGKFAASDGRPNNATADFAFNNTFTSLSLTLANTAAAGQLGGISSVLDGIKFSFSGASLSAFSLSSLSAPNGTVNCSTGTCIFNGAAVASLSGWTYNSTTGLLSAGNGSFKAHGIVNNNVTATDGITNSQHNPYFNGPVTFDFAVANASHTPLALTTATLYFGTRPDTQIATITPVPEPDVYALMLAGMGVVGFVARRRKPIGA